MKATHTYKDEPAFAMELRASELKGQPTQLSYHIWLLSNGLHLGFHESGVSDKAVIPGAKVPESEAKKQGLPTYGDMVQLL